MFLRFRSTRALAVLLCTLATPAAKAETDAPTEPVAFQKAAIEPVDAKDVPAMRITLSSDTLTRTETGYVADYEVKVFPFFFFNEHGTVRIEITPEAMRLLQQGGVISFSGDATNQHGHRRLVDGRVYPDDELTGRISLVVHVGSIELIFKTTYRLVGQQEVFQAGHSSPAEAGN